MDIIINLTEVKVSYIDKPRKALLSDRKTS